MHIQPTIHKTFSYWLWFTTFGVLALILANVPLFNLLAFEFCAVLALGISYVGAHVTLTTVQQMKRQPEALSGSPGQIVTRCFRNALIFNLGLLVLPVGIILLNALRIKNCNFSEGFIFFCLLPVISCVYATTAGIFFGFWIKRRWLAYLAYIGFLLLTYVPVVINLIFHPPVFAYHATFGYFPGPIYDFVIPITSTLLIARAETLLWALLFLGLAVSLCEISRHTDLMPQLRWRKLFSSLTKRVWLYLLIVCLIGFQFYAGALGIRPSRDDIAEALGGFRETEHFEIFYARELETEIENIVEDCEFQYAQLSAYLDPEGAELSRKVRAYIYAFPEQKKGLIGAGSTSVEDPFGHGFHIHAQGFPHPVLKHELAHVFTVPWSPLKVSLKIGLHEGIAVAADWSEGRLTAHQWAKAMREMEIAPPLSAIMGIGFWGHAGSRSYLLAGSFVRFLVDTYGIEKFKGVFKSVFPTGNFVKHYGKDLQLLETEWIDFLESVPLRDEDIAYASYRLKRRSVFEQVCTHEMAALRDTAWQAYYQKDFVTAVETFETMLSDEPDNLSTLRGLMYSAYRMQDYEKALSLANRIASAEDTRFSPEASLLIGDIYWLKNEHEKAMDAYVSIETVYGTFERRRMKRIAALSYPNRVQSQPNDAMQEERSLRELLRDVLVASKPVSEKMALLSVCIQIAPESWLPYFLTGELLQKEKAWQISNAYLHQAVERLIPQQHGKLILEVQRLIGINAYQQKDYETAQNTFRSIAENTALPLGEVLSAQDWIQRCQWAQSRTP